MNTFNKLNSAVFTEFFLGVFTLLTTACGPSEQSAEGQPVENRALASLVLEVEPTEILSVADARKQAKSGELVKVSGQIGGIGKPFVSGYAGFVLADASVTFCDEFGDDHCPTPWDACCEDVDKLNALRISVQFVDVESNPIEGDLKNLPGLKELDSVVVVGTVAEGLTADNMVINATGLFRNEQSE